MIAGGYEVGKGNGWVTNGSVLLMNENYDVRGADTNEMILQF